MKIVSCHNYHLFLFEFIDVIERLTAEEVSCSESEWFVTLYDLELLFTEHYITIQE
jgi:hypothetical protein